MKTCEQIAKALLSCQAVKISINPPFTWTSGIKSPVYCDNRKMTAFPDERDLIVEAFCERIESEGLEFDVVAGTATAGIAWAAFVAQKLKKPMVYIRSKPKGHGTGKMIEGHLEKGQKVLLVEDLISTGGSCLKAAKAIKEEGECEVAGVMAIVTYGFAEAAKAFAEADLKLETLTDFDCLAQLAAAQGTIENDQLEKVKEFQMGPREWADKLGIN